MLEGTEKQDFAEAPAEIRALCRCASVPLYRGVSPGSFSSRPEFSTTWLNGVGFRLRRCNRADRMPKLSPGYVVKHSYK